MHALCGHQRFMGLVNNEQFHVLKISKLRKEPLNIEVIKGISTE